MTILCIHHWIEFRVKKSVRLRCVCLCERAGFDCASVGAHRQPPTFPQPLVFSLSVSPCVTFSLTRSLSASVGLSVALSLSLRHTDRNNWDKETLEDERQEIVTLFPSLSLSLSLSRALSKSFQDVSSLVAICCRFQQTVYVCVCGWVKLKYSCSNTDEASMLSFTHPQTSVMTNGYTHSCLSPSVLSSLIQTHTHTQS